MKRKLLPKQQLFVNAYRVTLNAREAAEEAGYAHPKVQGCRLLTNVRVQEALADAAKQAETRSIVKSDDVLRELGKLAMVTLGHEHCPSTVKHAALVSLGRHYGLFIDNVNTNITGFVERTPVKILEKDFALKHNVEPADDDE